LPVAVAVGGAFAIKPLAALVTLIVGLSGLLPQDTLLGAAGFLPKVEYIVLGAMLLGAGLLALGALED